MYICYIDESGTSDVPGTSSHFVLAGVSVPIEYWRTADKQISQTLSKYGLEKDELHTAWMARKYLEQSRIANFENLDWPTRRSAVHRERVKQLLALQKTQNSKAYRQAKKNYKHSDAYTHLTFDERLMALRAVADAVASWGNVRLFAECIDKTHFDIARSKRSVVEQALEQVVSRFQQYLKIAVTNGQPQSQPFGLLVHDNNESVAKKHTELMRHFHEKGTDWTNIDNIIETPLFVDSSLTRMVQIADLCSYALRRYVENGETDLFQRIFTRADRSKKGKTVGVRHFTDKGCKCEICNSHR
jgi:Protein of unknown function (DUF3800)